MHALIGHRFTRGRIWMIAAIALVLIAGHGVILYTASKHRALSAGVVAGILLVIVVKHLGFLGPVFALFRRRWRKG
jgi:membrane protein YdbS with pleckstrin-like domain